MLWAFLDAIAIVQGAAPNWLLLSTLVPLFLILYLCFGLYPGVSVSPVDEIRSACLANTVGFILAGVILGFHGDALRAQIICIPACISAFLVFLALRAGMRRLGSRFDWWGHPVAIFGGADVTRSILQKLKEQPYLGLRPVAVFTDDAPDVAIHGISVHRLEHLTKIASCGVKHVIAAVQDLSRAELSNVIGIGCDAFPHVIVIRDADPVWKVGSYTQDLAGILGVRVVNNLLKTRCHIAKRTMDLALSISVTLFFLPVFAIICVLVAADSGLPVFYSQDRLGRGGRTFRVWKFRTMINNSAQVLERYLAANPELRREWAQSHKLRNDPRITRVGRFLRTTSLDELPQLWNVIRGDMSLVGPRPIVDAEVKKYHKHFSTYVKALPGMTGLWQVSGRNHTTYEERVAFDAYYVHNWSIWMDIYLLAKTISVVLTGHGAC